MPRLPMIDEENCAESISRALQREMALRGRLTNLKRVQAHSLAVLDIYAEWFTLKQALDGVITDVALFVFCLNVAKTQNSAIPIGYFRRALIGLGLEPENMVLDEEQALLGEFGRALGANAGHVADALWAKLAARYSTKALVELCGFAGIMVATTVFANLVQAEPEADVRPYLCATPEKENSGAVIEAG